ncbi:Survival of motor neuron--splicing factor 30 [Dispira simplex]|nr:Survival of motor neuron--splicing factor 30 [Dispira simplex]
MDPQELEGYRDQLKQVELLLKEDPSNADWLKLKSDLVEIITLSEGLLKPPAKATGQPELESISWKPGDKCLAKWSVDQQFYEAEIQTTTPQITVLFTACGNTDVVTLNDLKFLPEDPRHPYGSFTTHSADTSLTPLRTHSTVSTPGSTKAEATTPHNSTATATATATEPKSKKRKPQSSSASGPSKAKLQKDRQNSWLDFVQKKGKKKKAASAINTHSIFASPTTTQGKVGVVGSGQPMTEFKGRNKHVYRPVD